MRIGELLLQQGLITPAALEAGLRTQARYGGRLASVLVDLGAIDGDVATRALAKLRRVPSALQKHFDAADRRALSRIPAKVAEKYGAVALGFTGDDALIVAMRDPTDLLATEELRFLAGVKIVAGVALEMRIRKALERHYGVARKSENEFVAVAAPRDSDDFDSAREGNAWAVAPPPPARPPSSGSWRATPAGIPDLTLDPPPSSTGPRAHAAPPSVLPSVAPRADVTFTARPASLNAPAPSSVRPPPMRSVPPIPREEPPEHAPASTRGAPIAAPIEGIDASTALARAAAAPTFEGRVDALLAFLRSVFEAAIVFAVRNDVALTWKAFAPGLSPTVPVQVGIPLTQPSVLVVPYEARTPFVGAPTAGDPLQRRISDALRTPHAREVVVVPLVVDGNVVALVYAQPRAGERVPPTAVVELTRIAAAITRR